MESPTCKLRPMRRTYDIVRKVAFGFGFAGLGLVIFGKIQGQPQGSLAMTGMGCVFVALCLFLVNYVLYFMMKKAAKK